MKTTATITFLAFFALISCSSPKSTVNATQNQRYFAFNSEGDLISCELRQDRLVFNSLMNSESDKGISIMAIEERIDQTHWVVKNEQKTPPFSVISVRTEENFMGITPLITGESASKVARKFKEEDIPIWRSLFERRWYSQSKIDALKKAPGLDEIKREDLIAALDWRKSLSKQLKSYLEDNGGNGSFRVYRIVEEYRNQRLVEMGYNPYKRVSYNLQKRFENDKEVMRLLNQEIKFDKP
jgi:hypothetical protein